MYFDAAPVPAQACVRTHTNRRPPTLGPVPHSTWAAVLATLPPG